MASEVEDRVYAAHGPVLFGLALAVAAWVTLSSLGGAAIDPTSDEGYYLLYAKAVSERGLSAFPGLFAEWLAHEENWIYPPPSRVGFVLVAALWARLFGATLVALQWLSVAAHLCGAAVNYLFARKHLGEPRAAYAGALWVFSPLLMGLSRLPLTDSFVVLCASLSMWSFLDLVQRPESPRRWLAFMAAFGFLLLVKEIMLLLALPLVAFALIERLRRRTSLGVGGLALAFALPAVLVGLALVAAAGGLPPLIETQRMLLVSPATNEYALKFCSGPWFRYVIDHLCLAPVTTLLALGFGGALLLRIKRGACEPYLAFLGLVSALLVLELSLFIKSVRYTAVLEFPIRVFAACLLAELVAVQSRARSAALGVLAVAFLCWLEWRSFDLIWMRYRGGDPHSNFLLGLRHLIPYPYR